MRTAKHKGIARLVPTMDASKSYDAPNPMTEARAMRARMEQRFGLSKELTTFSAFMMVAEEMGLDSHTGLQEEFHPLMFQSARALLRKRSDPDLPSIKESINGPHAEEFWKAMDAEIASLEAKKAWDVVERSSIPAGMKAVPGTWAQRIKRKPSGELSKLLFRLGVIKNHLMIIPNTVLCLHDLYLKLL